MFYLTTASRVLIALSWLSMSIYPSQFQLLRRRVQTHLQLIDHFTLTGWKGWRNRDCSKSKKYKNTTFTMECANFHGFWIYIFRTECENLNHIAKGKELSVQQLTFTEEAKKFIAEANKLIDAVIFDIQFNHDYILSHYLYNFAQSQHTLLMKVRKQSPEINRALSLVIDIVFFSVVNIHVSTQLQRKSPAVTFRHQGHYFVHYTDTIRKLQQFKLAYL